MPYPVLYQGTLCPVYLYINDIYSHSLCSWLVSAEAEESLGQRPKKLFLEAGRSRASDRSRQTVSSLFVPCALAIRPTPVRLFTQRKW
jgi:hypothetical protein